MRDVKEVHTAVCRHYPSAFLYETGGIWTYKSEVSSSIRRMLHSIPLFVAQLCCVLRNSIVCCALRNASTTCPMQVSTPKRLKGLPAGCNVDVGTVPTLQELGVSSPAKGNNDGNVKATGKAGDNMPLRGGETEALNRLKQFVAQTRSRLRESMGANDKSNSSTGHGQPRAGLGAGAASAHFSTQVRVAHRTVRL